jgi:hypothetical protein
MKFYRRACAFLAVVIPVSLSLVAKASDNSVPFAENITENSPPWRRIERFRDMYAPFLGNGNHLITKIIDNKGNGYEPLYGLRNLRVVLHGVLYRGGANNAFHRSAKRDNSNPLPRDGLENLCVESFGEAIYLYEKNYVRQNLECTSRTGSNNVLRYSQVSVIGTPINGNPNMLVEGATGLLPGGGGVRDIVRRVHKCATGVGACPIYIHCWNGWHASGLVAAVALRQFCDFSADEAVQYWIDGTDSPQNANFPALKAAIREFIPLSEFRVSKELQTKICPANPYSR